jgi:hypothetical protein
MSGYDDYADRFLAALYLETEDTGHDFHSARSIHEKYGFSPEKSHWISRMADEWEYQYFKDVSKVLGGYDGWSFRISPDGYRKVEADFRDIDEVRDFLSQSSHSDDGSVGTSIRDSVEAEIVPASDRLVQLDHNQPDYLEIAKGLENLYEQVREDNQVGETATERDRLLRSLGAAKELWAAAELKLIQVQVGIVMAVEDANNAITKLGKAVGAALLVDLIKRFVKNATGIDF